MKRKNKNTNNNGMPKTLRINGTRYYTSDGKEKLPPKYILNYVSIQINKNNITIGGKVCFMCGNVFNRGNLHQITKHHAIPKMFSPAYDIFVPLCKACHNEFNLWMNEGISKNDKMEDLQRQLKKIEKEENSKYKKKVVDETKFLKMRRRVDKAVSGLSGVIK